MFLHVYNDRYKKQVISVDHKIEYLVNCTRTEM